MLWTMIWSTFTLRTLTHILPTNIILLGHMLNLYNPCIISPYQSRYWLTFVKLVGDLCGVSFVYFVSCVIELIRCSSDSFAYRQFWIIWQVGDCFNTLWVCNGDNKFYYMLMTTAFYMKSHDYCTKQISLLYFGIFFFLFCKLLVCFGFILFHWFLFWGGCLFSCFFWLVCVCVCVFFCVIRCIIEHKLMEYIITILINNVPNNRFITTICFLKKKPSIIARCP